ncbi:MAG TPA: DUF2911 domain-containing protein [Blastocatellia bacterium]|nr:DUF2911 domain-containing protein [Blastocatellia bacterium]
MKGAYKYFLLTAALLLAGAANAQEKKPAIIAFGSDSLERGTVRLGYWNREKNTGAGGFFIDYGKPVWKKDYEDPAKFDAMTRGKVWRLGSEYWTVLDTNIPLRVSETTVPPGQWYLGLHRSQDGAQWSLVFIDPSKVRGLQLDPSEINRAPIEHRAAMTSEPAGEPAEKLTLTLDVPKTDLRQSQLKISWGKLQLKAPVQVSVKPE